MPNQHYGSPDKKELRLALRREQTLPEALLWRQLRNGQIAGARFRRQHQFGPYIVDFYCHEHGVVVELDGSQHLEACAAVHDQSRTQSLETQGVKVLRSTNAEILTELDGVLWRISQSVTPSP